ASLHVRAVPACRTPARVSALSVERMPVRPWSTEWFDAVEQASHPAQAIARARARGVEKTG
ncbi:MAG TPA: hypothetical protein VK915_13620, partial [Gaiellaceae bacterium]|nr:hypothetical protein [Gaiellaceae bacterium]